VNQCQTTKTIWSESMYINYSGKQVTEIILKTMPGCEWLAPTATDRIEAKTDKR